MGKIQSTFNDNFLDYLEIYSRYKEHYFILDN